MKPKSTTENKIELQENETLKLDAKLDTRNISYDLLHICAAVMVVLLHISGQNWSSLTPDKAEWIAMNIYDSAAQSSVPIFFMLNGAFCNKRDIKLKELYFKKIIPLSVIWFAWSFLYAIDKIGLGKIFSTNFIDIITTTVNSHYHLWFIPTLIGLYILHPILKAIVCYKEGSYVGYLLVIFIIFSIVRETLLLFITNSICVTLITKVPVELMSYSCYMIMGYYFANISKRIYKPSIMLLLFGITVAICTYDLCTPVPQLT